MRSRKKTPDSKPNPNSNLTITLTLYGGWEVGGVGWGGGAFAVFSPKPRNE